MKKYLLILLVSVCFISVSNAQKLKVGVKLGANMGKIDGSGFSEKYTLGYHVGGFTEIGLGKKFGIQGEVLWNQLNADTATNIRQIYTELANQKLTNPQLNYLSIPLLLSYRPTKILSLQAGPQFGILLDKNKTLIDNGKGAFKDGDLSMLVGAQIKVLAVRVYGRYVIGLSDISDISSQEKWKNTGFQVGVGFAF
jgi:opacity protein-like surface antigen